MNDAPPPLYRPVPPPPPPAAPRRTGWGVYSVILTVLLFVSVLVNLVLFVVALGAGAEGGFGTHKIQLQEEYVTGNEQSTDKIALIHLSGIISSAEDGLATEDGLVGLIETQLQQALDDPKVKAVIIRINSPGGEVVASDMIYRAIREADEEKPVVACIDSMGASGGYYAAVGARYIVATDMSITASIGVIMQTFQFDQLAEKVGLKFHTFKSGKYKDLLNPAREPTPEEIALVNSLVMEIYNKFVGIVATERELDLAKLKDGVADGRILSGAQAKDAGLIDETGYFDDAVAAAEEFADISDAKIIRYSLPFSFRNLFRFLGESQQAKVQINVGPQQPRLENGKFYLLPPYMFR